MNHLLLKISKIIIVSFLFLIFSKIYAVGSVISTTELFNSTAYGAGFVPQEPYTAAGYYKGSAFLIWNDAKYRPWVTQVTNGVVTTVPLDSNPDYTTQPDGHNRYSLGIDKNGYIHITGDMHHYMNLTTTGGSQPYPARYQKQTILYWKSNKPGDVTGGFVFAGGLNASTAIPGGGWMMGRFFADNNSELYYSSQVHAYESLSSHGQMAVGLYKYDAKAQTWSSIGGIAPFTDSYMINIFPVFYWENSGFYTGTGTRLGWFQNYQAHFSFDSQNRMYFAVTGNTDETIAGADRIIFAMSEDGGLTWKRADGTVIATLPIRGVSGLPASGDIVATSTASPYFSPLAGVVVDKNNKPGISVNYKWWVWDGKAWTNKTPQNFASLPVGALGYRLPDNSLVIDFSNVNKNLFTSSFDSPSIGYDYVNYKGIASIDAYTLKTSGIIYNVGAKSNGTESLLQTTITPAPLPTGWNFQDIDTVTTGYGGNAGYLNNTFTMTSYGANLSYQASDSFTYAYEPMVGDGTITARVNAAQGDVKAGLMMRETLDPGSKHVSVLLNLYPNNLTAQFIYRATANTVATTVETAGIAAPYWLRLVRAGDVFTSFISADGKTWQQTQTITLPMNKSIFVGLANSASASRWYMQKATFDNVSAPVSTPVCTRANPTLAITPTTQSGAAGGNVTYTLSLTNNDSTSCPSSTFNLNSTIPISISGKLNDLSLVVAPGKSLTTTLNVASLSSTISDSYTIGVNAVNSAATSSIATASSVYQVTGGCALQEPTIAYTPTSQTTFGTNSLSYSLTVLNNDSSACQSRLFQFSTLSSSTFVATSTEPNNTYISPGQTLYGQVTATPKSGITAGTYTMSTSTQNGGLGKGTLVYTTAVCTRSNPVVTLLPSSVSVNGGETGSFSVMIANNDTVACGPSIYSVNTSIPSNMSGKLNTNVVSIAPGGSAAVNLDVTSLTSTPAANYGFSVAAFNLAATHFTASGTASFVVVGGCMLKTPTLIFSPATQTTKNLIPLNYSLSVLNNDSSQCLARQFDLGVSTSSSFLGATISPTSALIAPGQTVATIVTAAPVTGLTAGTYTLTSTATGGAKSSASLVYSVSGRH